MSINADLFKNGWQILNSRDEYEAKQRKWWIMRHMGLRRARKPFPTAADLHLKLIDEKVNQKKAFTMATVLGQPQLATFVSMKSQPQPITDSAGAFFSCEMKERSNFLRVLLTAVDTMWLRGRGIIKSYVDPFDDYRLKFENVDPLYLLMPDDVDGFDDSYEWVHVRQMNVKQFKLDRRYCAHSDYRDDNGEIQAGTLKKLCGGPDVTDRLRTQRGRDLPLIQEDKELREGYTHSNSSDTIIIWEHYVRTMGGMICYSYCPSALDVEIRKPYGVPYKVGGRVSPPYFSIQAEVKDEGWYAPRGVAEKIADDEIYGCKMWNAKADAITFYGTPQYTAEVGVQNPANYRVAPGEVLPPGVRPAPPSTPPVSFDQEIAFARSEAEMATASVDMGIRQTTNPGSRGEKRTAKEVGIAASLSQVGQNLENHTFKDDLSKLYKHCWGLMLQYKRMNLAYYVADDLQTLPEVALHEAYAIQAGGATDDWDKAARLQKAGQRFEALKGLPNINQDELVTDFLAADDSRLVKRLVVLANVKATNEMTDENTIINDLCPGPNRPSLPIPVLPGQDHFTRAKAILMWMDAAGKMGTPVSPAEKQRLFQRLQQHVMMLKKTNPEQFKQLAQMIKQLEGQGQRPEVSAPMSQPMGRRGGFVRPRFSAVRQ